MPGRAAKKREAAKEACRALYQIFGPFAYREADALVYAEGFCTMVFVSCHTKVSDGL